MESTIYTISERLDFSSNRQLIGQKPSATWSSGGLTTTGFSIFSGPQASSAPIAGGCTTTRGVDTHGFQAFEAGWPSFALNAVWPSSVSRTNKENDGQRNAGTSLVVYTVVTARDDNPEDLPFGWPHTTRLNCITLMEQYKCKSLEELRLEDYTAGRNGRRAREKKTTTFEAGWPSFALNAVWPSSGSRIKKENDCQRNTGTSLVAYTVVTGRYDNPEGLPFGWPHATRLNCITLMDEYKCKSLEELRLEDYTAGRNGRRPSEKTASETTDLLESINEVWRCPICLELAVPPLQMCNHGHISCKKCCENLSRCAVCRARFSEVPARAVEQVLELIPRHPSSA